MHVKVRTAEQQFLCLSLMFPSFQGWFVISAKHMESFSSPLSLAVTRPRPRSAGNNKLPSSSTCCLYSRCQTGPSSYLQTRGTEQMSSDTNKLCLYHDFNVKQQLDTSPEFNTRFGQFPFASASHQPGVMDKWMEH